jgi:polar amino acid transport system substrate-binding protein
MILSRRNVMSGLAAGAAGLIGAPAAFAQTPGGLLERLRREKVAKVAIAPQPPYSELLPDGTMAGLGPTVAQTIMTKLGVPKLEGVAVPYGELIPGLMAGRWDFVAACLSITKPRCNQVQYSSPICFDSSVVAYLPADLPEPPKTAVEIGKRGLIVGVLAGGYQIPYLRTVIPSENILQFPDTAALGDVLLIKRIQVALAAYSGLSAVQKNRNPSFSISPPLPDIRIAGSGPAFRPNDTDLFDAFEKELRAMKDSGEIARLNEQFGFQYVRSLDDPITMKEACAIAL